MFELSIFTIPETWISLFTLLFLEIILGVDNIVFISLTSNRLPKELQHLGRKLGLAGAMLMRIVFLCVASFFVHLSSPLFTINVAFYTHSISIRDIVLFVGGVYLIYKGITELIDLLKLKEEKESQTHPQASHQIGLMQAVVTIMLMDIVFSIDSVITAVGLAQYLIVMILAVVIAVLLMMVFIDPISEFIDKNAEMKILALTFIALIGLLLTTDALGIHSGLIVLDMSLEKLLVYFAMLFSVVMEFIQIRYKNNLSQWHSEQKIDEACQENSIAQKTKP